MYPNPAYSSTFLRNHTPFIKNSPHDSGDTPDYHTLVTISTSANYDAVDAVTPPQGGEEGVDPVDSNALEAPNQEGKEEKGAYYLLGEEEEREEVIPQPAQGYEVPISSQAPAQQQAATGTGYSTLQHK